MLLFTSCETFCLAQILTLSIWYWTELNSTEILVGFVCLGLVVVAVVLGFWWVGFFSFLFDLNSLWKIPHSEVARFWWGSVGFDQNNEWALTEITFLQSPEGFVLNSGNIQDLIRTVLFYRLTVLQSSDGYLVLFELLWNGSAASSFLVISSSLASLQLHAWKSLFVLFH